MDIRSVLIPNYLNDLEQQDAEIENVRANTMQQISGANVNNAQANRINALLPGELQQQRLSNQGLAIDNQGKQIVNEGNAIINQLNRLKQSEQFYINKKHEVEANHAEENAQLEMESKRLEQENYRAQIRTAAVQQRAALAELDAHRQTLVYNEYPKISRTMGLVSYLMGKGDLAGANNLYKSMLATLPPEVLESEGFFSTIGDSIEAEEVQYIQAFSDYAAALVPSDSQMGMSARDAANNQAALEEAQIRATGNAGDALVNRKRMLDIEAAASKQISPVMASNLIARKLTTGQPFTSEGEPIDPILAIPYNKLRQFAVQMKVNNDIDLTSQIGKAFQVEERVGIRGMFNDLEDVLMPQAPDARERLMARIQEIMSDKQLNVSSEQAYRKAIDEEIDIYMSLFE